MSSLFSQKHQDDVSRKMLFGGLVLFALARKHIVAALDRLNLTPLLTNDWRAFVLHMCMQLIIMHFMWIICIARTNGSMVDFGWPFGFTLMATMYAMYGTGSTLRRYLICGMYIVCGLRFMFGWLFGRKHWSREDHRWALWRNRWRNGFGWFGITSEEMNFFFFYHAQSMTNAFIMSVPLHLVCARDIGYHADAEARDSIHPLEIAAVLLWMFAFAMENVADFQLSQFQIQQRRNEAANPISKPVFQGGLWRYSRHPNYFCEFLIWVSYALFALPSASYWLHYVMLAILPVVAYYFLVNFTGIFMAEQASLQRRGEAYKQYMDETPAFFPWFPKLKTKGT